MNFQWIFFLNLYFDKRNQPGQHLQVTFHIFSNQIYFLTWNPENWFWFCVLTGKIKKIHLHFGFDRKNSANWFEFWLIDFLVFKKKAIWSTIQVFFNLKAFNKLLIIYSSGYFLYIFKSNFDFDRKNPANSFEIMFWPENSLEIIFWRENTFEIMFRRKNLFEIMFWR